MFYAFMQLFCRMMNLSLECEIYIWLFSFIFSTLNNAFGFGVELNSLHFCSLFFFNLCFDVYSAEEKRRAQNIKKKPFTELNGWSREALRWQFRVNISSWMTVWRCNMQRYRSGLHVWRANGNMFITLNFNILRRIKHFNQSFPPDAQGLCSFATKKMKKFISILKENWKKFVGTFK